MRTCTLYILILLTSSQPSFGQSAISPGSQRIALAEKNYETGVLLYTQKHYIESLGYLLVSCHLRPKAISLYLISNAFAKMDHPEPESALLFADSALHYRPSLPAEYCSGLEAVKNWANQEIRKQKTGSRNLLYTSALLFAPDRSYSRMITDVIPADLLKSLPPATDSILLRQDSVADDKKVMSAFCKPCFWRQDSLFVGSFIEAYEISIIIGPNEVILLASKDVAMTMIADSVYENLRRSRALQLLVTKSGSYLAFDGHRRSMAIVFYTGRGQLGKMKLLPVGSGGTSVEWTILGK